VTGFGTVQHRLRALPQLREGKTGICLNVNGDRAGGAFGYVDMGGWIGGQAEYVMAPYADFNLLELPTRPGIEKIRTDAAFRHLSDGYTGR
jgi:threonine dehydrogenase-like Zn-dependent dehydrogenase